MAEPRGALAPRLASAAVLIPLAVGVDLVGGWAFAILVAAGALGLAWEWGALTAASPLAGLGGLAVAWLATVALGPGAGFVALALAGAVAFVVARGWGLLGTVYIGVPMIALLALRARPDDGWLVVLGLFCVVWATDTGAFAVGRTLGGPKLAPRWSPGKTWAGAFGGLAGGVLVALVAGAAGLAVDLWPVVVIAAALSVAGQIGDLAESVVKRRFHRKDSGHLIPGHGGLFDRLDSLLVAAPVLALAVSWGGDKPWLLRAAS